MVQLTAGICARLHQSTPNDIELFDGPHTVQFLSVEKDNSANSSDGVDRFRIIVSDGINFLEAMLATQLNSIVNDRKIGKNTVAVIEKLTCNYVQEEKLFIILALRVLGRTNEKIGYPTSLDAPGLPQNGDLTLPPAPMVTPAASSSAKPPVQAAQPSNPVPAVKGGRGSIIPIEDLTDSLYQNNWTIKACVTQKSDIRNYSNAGGDGKVFSVTLIDETGEIRGTGFNLAVDELYHKLEKGKVYYISKARIKSANKKFSNIANDYELSLDRNTEVEECHEKANLPMIKYHFVPLGGLKHLAKGSTCDVIAIVKAATPLTEITIKQENRQALKRELTLVDQSGCSVRMTLWGKQAEQYSAENSPVIAFMDVKVGDFGGRSLSMISSSSMTIKPDIPECFALRGWYDTSEAGQSFQVHPNTGGGGLRRTEMRSISEVKKAQLGEHDKVDHYSARATITHIMGDNICYPACPTPQCNKKVIEINGSWRCEKCSKSFDAPEYRYNITLAVADSSSQTWLQAFNDVGVAVFGMSAHDLVQIRDNNKAEFNMILHRANWTTCNILCRAKQAEYKETTRTQHIISSVTPLNYKEETVALRDLLQSPWAR